MMGHSWLLRSGITFGVLLGGVAAQSATLVLPAGRGVGASLGTREGNHSFHLPAKQAPSRVLVVYRGADLGVGPRGMRIGSIAFRRDGERSTAYRAHRWLLSVTMSSQGVRLPSEIQADSFEAAHGTDRTLVLDRKFVNWPAEAKPSNPPASFRVKVTLDTPFLLLPGRNLCIDLVSDTESKKAENLYWYTDAELFDRSSATGRTRFLGRGCPFAFQTRATVPALDGESRVLTYSYTRATASGGALAFLVAGTSNRAWGSRSLPFDLVGASGCRMYTNPVFVQPVRSVPNEPRGLAQFWSGRLPALKMLEGLKFYQQAFVSDATANPLGLRSSNYLEVTLGRVAEPLPARLIYHSGPDVKPTPTKAVDAGLVIELGG